MTEVLKDGYIIDYISGLQIKGTPEEIQATQVFAKRLVEEYEYEIGQIQTRPQYYVRKTPSDEVKEYPIDIGIFNGSSRAESDLIGVVECKKESRKDGIEQLKLYMDMCSTVKWGVWFNGKEQINLEKRKIDGDIIYSEIPNIPKKGQRIEDIGKYKRKDLKPAKNLKVHFKVINNYLYGNMKQQDTSTRNRAKQIINLLFCKIYDEQYTGLEEEVSFRAGVHEDKGIVKTRIVNLFNEVKRRYSDVFEAEETIDLNPGSIVFFVGQLQELCITESERDVIGDAFEVFVSQALKGDEGQFFTPRNVIRMIVEIVDPDENTMVIDPSCGTGGFLIESLRYVWNKIDEKAVKLGWSERRIDEEKQYVATSYFRGIDKDSFVAKVTKAYMAIIGDGRGGIFCENSLEPVKNWSSKCQDKIDLGKFDLVLTNPPFGSKIPIKEEEILKQFNLGYKWKFDKKEDTWEKQNILNNKGKTKGVAPQILFIERCIQFLKIGGKLGIVLPDGIYGNDKLGYIRQFIKNNMKILAIIDIPKETFQPNTSTKTTVLIAEKIKEGIDIPEEHNVFMAICETCGHNRRGELIDEDDISLVSSLYKKEVKSWGERSNAKND
ncbi:restriction endonuclease subunit M [Terrilactibacillus laevilacticus]|uniref:Restriction endonuclease subunit M n=2 Tax=Terrilactibacillus laevilacticus TaxID=1380157 RepID=A0ABW5PNU4_9BACI|nr:N-6 DNA methylase [Terrilactibacillus laevilacticus]